MDFWMEHHSLTPNQEFASINVACTQGQGFGKFKAIVHSFQLSNLTGHLPQVLLSICAVVSLTLGLFQHFSTTHPEGDPLVDWVEGVTIIVAVLIIVSVGSLNDLQKEKQFEGLNEKREEHFIQVIHDGKEQLIDVHDVVVGDVMLLKPSKIIPCNGVFLSGHNIQCNECSVTGESDAIKKLPYQECIALRNKCLADF